MERFIKEFTHPKNNLIPFFILTKIIKEIRKKIYKTEEHPEVATTLALIAEQWRDMGDYQKALEQFERVLRKKSSIDNDIHVFSLNGILYNYF